MSIFSHAVLGTNDPERAQRFYDAPLAPLGSTRQGPYGENGMMYGAEGPEWHRQTKCTCR